VLSQLFTVPVLLHAWGVGLYGEWLILSAFPAYLAMTDIGFGSAAANEMTIKVGAGDRDGALEAFQSSWLFISYISVAAALLAIAFVWVFPIEGWLNLARMSHGVVAGTLALLFIVVIVSLQGSLVAAGFRCEGLYANEVFLSNILRLSEFGGLMLVVALGAGPFGAAMSLLVVRSLGTLWLRVYLHRVAPWIVFGTRAAHRDTVKRLASPALAFMAFPLGNALLIQGTVVIVAAILSPVAVVVLTTTRTVTNIVRQAIGIITLVVWPELSLAYGANNMELARKLHRYACQASLFLAIAASVVLFVAGEWLLKVWTNGAVEFHPAFFRLMLLVVVVNTLWYTSSVVQGAINKHQKMAVYYVLGASASLLFATVMTPAWGLIAIPIGLLLVDTTMSSYVLRKSLALLNDRFGDFAASLLTLPDAAVFGRLLPRRS
jgi:O-antigen/teichoic acid export membrane protein